MKRKQLHLNISKLYKHFLNDTDNFFYYLNKIMLTKQKLTLDNFKECVFITV